MLEFALRYVGVLTEWLSWKGEDVVIPVRVTSTQIYIIESLLYGVGFTHGCTEYIGP